MAKKILILAGGGGHTGYAQILADELKDRAELLFFAPDDDPLSKTRLEQYGKVITITKPRHPTTPIWSFTFRFLKAFYQSLRRVSRDTDVIVSTGSNFCIPPALIGWTRGIPLVNLESRVKFTEPSRTAAILQHFAEITALQWEEQRNFLNGIVFGPLLPKKRIEPWDGGYILVTGGTYGYEELFNAFLKTDFENVVLQTGNLNGGVYERKRPLWRIISFTDRFDELLAGAEVVVCPPGGTPIEAIVYGKPIVLVRYPQWARAASLEETKAFAQKLNAPLLQTFSPVEVVTAIEEAKARKIPFFKNGTWLLSNKILSL